MAWDTTLFVYVVVFGGVAVLFLADYLIGYLPSWRKD